MTVMFTVPSKLAVDVSSRLQSRRVPALPETVV
jgi:hypothetical protein